MVNTNQKKIIMLTPGLLHVSPRVWQAGYRQEYNHRDPALRKALAEIKKNLYVILNISDHKYDFVLFNSTGRGAVEGALSAMEESGKTMVVANGRWGKYMQDIAKRYNKQIICPVFDFDKPLPIPGIKKNIEKHQPKWLCFVTHETERGVYNPSKEIATMAKKNNCFVMVDAMSSVVVNELNYNDFDVFVFSSAKGLRSTESIGIVALRKKIITELGSAKNHYFNLLEEYTYQTRMGFTRAPLTPQSLLALREATNELLEEGVAHRRQDIHRKFHMLLNWAQKHQVLKFGTRPEYLGGYTLPLLLPRPWIYSSFRDALIKKGYFVFYAYEGMNGRSFEVSPAGYLSDKEISGFMNAVDKILL